MGHGRLVRYYIYRRSEGKIFYEHYYLRWPARKECPGGTTTINAVIVPASSREDRLMLCCLISCYITVNSICNLHSLFLHVHRIHPHLFTQSLSRSLPIPRRAIFICLFSYLFVRVFVVFVVVVFFLLYYLLLTLTLDVTAGLSLMTLNYNL